MPEFRQLLQLRRLFQQQVSVRTSLYTQIMRSVYAEEQKSDDAVRWLESIRVNHSSKPALFMHPNANAEYLVTVQPKTKFVSHVALLPEAWEQNTSGVEFMLLVQAETGQGIQKKVFIHPYKHKHQRAWNSLTLDLSPFAGQTVKLTLSTRVPSLTSAAYAWAVWGEPCLVTPRSAREVIKTGVGLVKTNGMIGAMQRVFHLAEIAQHASEPYYLWQLKHQLQPEELNSIMHECKSFTYAPTISIVMPVYNVDPKWLRLCIESVRNQYYKKWELCICDDGSTNPNTIAVLKSYQKEDSRIKIRFSNKNSGIAEATNQALALASGEFIGLLDNDDELAPEALYEVVKLLQNHPEADMIYSDEDKLEEDGTRSSPFFKPDWSPEYFLSCMYTSHFGVYRRNLVKQVGGFRSEYDKAQDYDLALRIIETTQRIFHIPKILYHWRKIATSTASSSLAKKMDDLPAKRAVEDYVRRNTLDAVVEVDPLTTYHRVRYIVKQNPLVSIIIPFKDKVELLKKCIPSILQKTQYQNFEILLVSNNSTQEETVEYVNFLAREDSRIRNFSYNVPFNYSKVNNWAVEQAKGSHFLFMNNDTEVINAEWLTALLEFSQQPETGMVGAKLYYPDDRIQHCGVVMGIGGGASHVFIGNPKDNPGYFSSTKLIRNYSVVTAACAMIKRKVFEEVNGFDESFRVDYNDVDLCLRILEKGYRNVFTPFAELYHYESMSLGSRAGKVRELEEVLLRHRWAKVIANDPYYNPNLSLQDTNYHIRL